MATKQDYDYQDSPEDDLENWDKIRCARCGQMISMLYADTVNNGSAFVHRGGICPNPSPRPKQKTNHSSERIKW